MRPSWLLMFLLLLSILIHHAQGIRLISKGSVAADRQLSLQEKHGVMRSNGGVEGGIDNDGYKSKKWSGSIRKLTTIHIFSNIGTIAKKNHEKNEEMKAEAIISSTSSSSSNNQNIAIARKKQENLCVNSPSKTQQLQPTPDILDIAAMDYTLARRKPPIHN